MSLSRSQPDKVTKAPRAFVRSDVGLVRSNNEDACAISAAKGKVSEWSGCLPAEGGWALLADGLGGHAAGEVASTLAIAALRLMVAGVRSEADIARAIQSADSALYIAMEHEPELRGMGTTIAGVLLQGQDVIAFNVGDSRAYAFAEGKLRQLSVDDVVDGNFLTQCLGGAQDRVDLIPHVTRVSLAPGMALLLCSDGLTDMLSDEEITHVLSSGPADPAEALVEAALKAGGHDNVSVILIQSEP